MPETLNDALAKLEKLQPEKLDEVSQRIRKDLGGAEWKMSICLLALTRQRSFRELGYSTITEYAERVLHLSGKKVAWLLGTARALEHLPLMSEAFRTGQLCWGKLRALQSVVTPETEHQWLDFALAHRTDQVVNKVTASPRQWKRQQALQASLENRPTATPEAVTRVLRAPEKAERPLQENPPGETLFEESPTPESPPRTIRVVLEMTPDQFALYEAAEKRVRDQEGPVARGVVVTRMAEAVLNQGTSRARARYQVVVHTNPETKEQWYNSSKGRIPASPEVLEEALKPGGNEVIFIDDLVPEEPPQASEESPTRDRQDFSNATVRAVHARAGHCCERCGQNRGRLHIHHKTPVSEGGDNSLDNLRLLCIACHTMEHEKDFEKKPHWRRARDSRVNGNPPGETANGSG